jgi:hypothetical protein
MIQLCIDRFKYYGILLEISPLGDLWTLAGSPMKNRRCRKKRKNEANTAEGTIFVLKEIATTTIVLRTAWTTPAARKATTLNYFNKKKKKTSLRDAVIEMQNGDPGTNVVKCITGFIMTQMLAKAGIKKHGKAAVETLFQEFLQFHELGVFKAKRVKDLSAKQIKEALRAISVIK